MAINWYKDDQVSKYFTVNDCLYLPHWNRNAIEADGLTNSVKGNLIILCNRLDVVRDFLNMPMTTTVCYRPAAYNAQIGGAKNSQHILGSAMDFTCAQLNADEVRKLLEPKLEEWGLRMENLPGSNWVHLDQGPVITNRFFKP